MKVIIAGGGTGGHLYAAVALAKEFERRDGKVEILFVGTEKGIEGKVVPRLGYTLRTIRVEAFSGQGFLRKAIIFFRIPLSLLDSLRILNEFSPDIVIGVGGYPSGPLLLTASLKGIPTLIHEQNTIPGITNRILSRFVDGVAIGFKGTERFFSKGKTRHTGNPIREEIASAHKDDGLKAFGLYKDRFTLFIFGGSRGARRINDAMAEALSYLTDLKDSIQLIHQTGEEDYARISEFYSLGGFKASVFRFIEDMAEAYAASDLIVSRAGAETISEITACGKASILIPYPYATHNHQGFNAKSLLDAGAAQVIPDRELNGKRLSSEIRLFIEDPERLWLMEMESKRLGSSDGARKVVDLSMEIIDSKIRDQDANGNVQEV